MSTSGNKTGWGLGKVLVALHHPELEAGAQPPAAGHRGPGGRAGRLPPALRNGMRREGRQAGCLLRWEPGDSKCPSLALPDLLQVGGFPVFLITFTSVTCRCSYLKGKGKKGDYGTGETLGNQPGAGQMQRMSCDRSDESFVPPSFPG